MSNRRRAGLVMMVIGIMTVAAGLGLGAYNLWDDYRAGLEAGAELEAIVQYQEEAIGSNLFSIPEPDQEMPVVEIEENGYIGTVSIPAINIKLPVHEIWNLALLKTAPCRYKGSAYQGNLIICAHNYATHFGRLKNLLPGDEVVFTDMDGNVFRYAVKKKETLAGSAVEEMERGDWDLTLFTCTIGGRTRVTVRCDLLMEGDGA